MTINAVIFDRDGTLIKYVPYLKNIDDIEFYPGVINACQQLLANNIKLFMATNQSGIARGYFTEDDYAIIERNLIKFQSFW